MVSEGKVKSTSNIALAALFWSFTCLSSLTEVQLPQKYNNNQNGKECKHCKTVFCFEKREILNSKQWIKKCITFFDNGFNMSVPTKIMVYSNTK